MTRRSLSFVVLVAAALFCLASPVGARMVGDGADASTSSTVNRLPRTDAEAEQLDDGNNLGAPWVIGSAVAAGAVVLVGGLWMKRRMEREA